MIIEPPVFAKVHPVGDIALNIYRKAFNGVQCFWEIKSNDQR